MGAQGTAVIDFTSTPSIEATVVVSGQSTILTSSLVEAWIMGSTTVDNNEGDHLFGGVGMKLTVGIPVAGSGFTIYATIIAGLATGTFNIQWVWN